MYYRIEVRDNNGNWGGLFRGESEWQHALGLDDYDDLMKLSNELPYPSVITEQRELFYFTERGWDYYGKRLLRMVSLTEFEARVVCALEHQHQCEYDDEYQVTLRVWDYADMRIMNVQEFSEATPNMGWNGE